MSDLFVRAWPEGCDYQDTDTHWRAKKGRDLRLTRLLFVIFVQIHVTLLPPFLGRNGLSIDYRILIHPVTYTNLYMFTGKASWNYRLLFDVELGHNTRAMKFSYLHIQLWDKDILKWNDCLGESIFDMKKHYTKAFKKNVAVNIFEKRKGAALARKRKARQNLKNAIPDKKLDVVEEEYYPGTIVDIYDNGSYAVQFEGEQEPEVQIPEHMIKSQEEIPKKAFIVGCVCICLCRCMCMYTRV